MKVALVVGQFPALSETFVLDQITGLLDRGAEVDIYAGGRRPQPAVHPAVDRYSLVERTTYSVPEPEGTVAHRARVLQLLLPALRRTRGALRIARSDANAALRFSNLAGGGTRRYDVIHCHFGPHGMWGMAMRNTGLLSGKLVTTFHGYDLSRYLRETRPDVYQRLFQEGDLFLPISRFWRDKLVSLGCAPEKIRVHHMGVDCDNFPFTARVLPDDGGFRILTVGRLTEKKGIEYAIRGVAAFAKRHPKVNHTIIGDGPLRSSLEALIRELKIGENVNLAGARTRDEVEAAMSRSHLLLAPSVTAADGNQEGIPVVLMEAMASGLPVLSTRHTGIPELVESGITGQLVDERDVTGIAAGMAQLLEDSAAYSRVAVAARSRVEEEFDVDRLNDGLFQTFQQLQK
jgi:colanic acid/amylovoran biosynthesis glycosyltransferase